MAKIVVETAKTKKEVTEALRNNDFQSAVELYRKNAANGQPFGTILSGDVKNGEHRLLLQINPSDDDQASGSFVIGFRELADAAYDALSYDAQIRSLSDYPAFGEDSDAGFSEPKTDLGACEPAEILERKRAEANALAVALGSAADKLRADVPRYDALLAKMKRPENK